MKTLITFSIFLLSANPTFSQSTFTINSQIGTQSLQVNGIDYQIDSIGTKVKTHYPLFDTLVFTSDVANRSQSILCNFKPDSLYSLYGACCGSIDIISAYKLNNDSIALWDYDTEYDKIQNALLDKPFLSIRCKDNPSTLIYAWHADAACETEYKAISKKMWRLGVPPKCFYWSNITSIQFFKTDLFMPAHKSSSIEDFLGIMNIVELASVSFRFFDDQCFIIIYDEENNSVEIVYE